MNDYGNITGTCSATTSISNSNVVVQNNVNTVVSSEIFTEISASTSVETYTSTTAPGILFTSRNELAIHYKSDWHKYNLKRREANLPVLLYNDFMIRYNAAIAVKSAQEQYNNTNKNKSNNKNNNNNTNTGTDHLKKKKNKKDEMKKNKKSSDTTNGSYTVSQVSAYDKIKNDKESLEQEQQQQQQQSEQYQEMMVIEDCETIDTNSKAIGIETKQEQEQQDPTVDDVIMVAPTTSTTTTISANEDDKVEIEGVEDNNASINPCQCLFDNTIHTSVTKNIQYMYKKYSFYIPDKEYLIDTSGLIGYCHEKIILGHTCLYCQRIFTTVQACKQHMIDTQHTKILYEPTIDLDEYSIFYDFTQADNEFILSTTNTTNNSKVQTDDTSSMLIEDVKEEDIDNDEEWEDEDDDDIDIDDEFLDDYEANIQKTTTLGWDVTPLGEIVFPDGRIIGHRALRRYYKQKPQLRNKNDEYKSDAVQAALLGCRERLYRGNVYTIGGGTGTDSTSSSTSLEVARQQSYGNSHSYNLTKALFQQNNLKSTTMTGRVGNGILVSNKSSNGGGTGNVPYYTQLSVYRYRAALSKQHKMEHKIRTIQQKQSLNMNHMDKKHNRIMNGVSVQHAKR